MYKNDNMRWRKAVARMLCKMVFEPENGQRTKVYVHTHYARRLLGVDYDTFLSYIDEGKDDLKGFELPLYMILGLWEMVQLHQGDSTYEELQKRTGLKIPHEMRRGGK